MMNKSLRNGVSLLALTALTGMLTDMLGSGIAEAQVNTQASKTETSAFEEIVVTATRRAESIRKVPVSVTAITQTKMDVLGIKDVDGLFRLTPGVQFTRGAALTANASNISIRGIASSVGSATTGIYIDDTPIQIRSILNTGGNSYPKVFDLQRVEILKGPQGTLFGAGSEGGAVRFITPEPNLNELSVYTRGEVSFTKGGQASYEGGAAIGAPIIENKIGIRLSAWYRQDGGYIDRVDPNTASVVDKNTNSANTLALRGAIAFRPTEALTITPSVLYQRVRNHERGQYLDPKSGTFGAFTDPDQDQFRTVGLAAQPLKDHFTLPALKIEYDFDAVQVISNTSFFIRDEEDVRDYSFYLSSLFTGSDFGQIGTGDPSYNTTKQRNFTQELRLQSGDPDSRLQWVFGVFYQNNRQTATQNSTDNTRPGAFYQAVFGAPLLPDNVNFSNTTRARDRQIAGFGELTYSVTDKLKAIAGVRVARTKYDFKTELDGPIAGGPGTETGQQSETPITPKFGLSYQANEDNFLYATVSKGFRIGGAQGGVNVLCGQNLAQLGYTSAPNQYDSDSVWSYEVGSKNKLADGRVLIDGSLFYIDWKDIQQRVVLGQCGGQFIDNLGQAVSKGFDLSVQVMLTSNLDFGASVGYQNTKFSSSSTTPSGAVVASKGDKIGGSPWNIALSMQYQLPFAEELEPFVRVDYQYRNKGPAQDPLVFGYDSEIQRKSATNFVSVRAGGVVSGWDVSVFADNLFDSHAILSQGREPITSVLFFDTTFRPRTIGLTVVRNF